MRLKENESEVWGDGSAGKVFVTQASVRTEPNLQHPPKKWGLLWPLSSQCWEGRDSRCLRG